MTPHQIHIDYKELPIGERKDKYCNEVLANTNTKTYHRWCCGHTTEMKELNDMHIPHKVEILKNDIKVLDIHNPIHLEELESYKRCKLCMPPRIESLMEGVD